MERHQDMGSDEANFSDGGFHTDSQYVLTMGG